MLEKIEIKNLQNSNIDDLIYVCSSARLGDPTHQEGIEHKKRWLKRIFEKYGSCAKIAYYKSKPVAQILYYPEEADITKAHRRENVLVIHCIYNPVAEAQKLGIGTSLLQGLIQDAKNRRTCLGNKPCKFMLANAFDTGEFLPMPDFYKKNGFVTSSEGNMLYHGIKGKYESAKPVGDYEPLPEDRNRAVLFYSPTCQFGYAFAKKTEELIKEVAPRIKTEVIDEWEAPAEFIKWKNCRVIVNAKPIRTFFMDTEKFKMEIKQTVG